MRPSGALSLTVPVCGGSLIVVVSITLPDLISLLCFTVHLHSISAAVGNTDSYINLLDTHRQQREYRQRQKVDRERARAGAIETEIWEGLLNRKKVSVKICGDKTSLKTTSLRGDLVPCLCSSTSDSSQVVLSGCQGRVGQRNNICYCAHALIRLINILHVSPAVSDCVPSGLG